MLIKKAVLRNKIWSSIARIHERDAFLEPMLKGGKYGSGNYSKSDVMLEEFFKTVKLDSFHKNIVLTTTDRGVLFCFFKKEIEEIIQITFPKNIKKIKVVHFFSNVENWKNLVMIGYTDPNCRILELKND